MSKRDYEKEVQSLMSALAESVVETPDTELLEEVSREGRDLQKTAQSVKATLLSAVDQVAAKRRDRLRSALEARRVELRNRSYELPHSPQGRRALLQDLLSRQPALGQQLTMAHRNLENWNDADVSSALRQASDLGLLDKKDDTYGPE